MEMRVSALKRKWWLSFLFLSACGHDVGRSDLLPDASGEHGHILIVADDDLWASPLKQTLTAQLEQTAQGPYLRPEPLFDYFRKSSEKLTHVNKMSRVIVKLLIDTDTTYATTTVVKKYNYYAKGQLFLVIKDHDADRLHQFLTYTFDTVIDAINDFELNTLVQAYTNRAHAAIREQSSKKFGLAISLPRESKLRVNEEDFMWIMYDRSREFAGDQASGIRRETYWIMEGMVLWSEKVTDLADFTPEYVLQARDTLLKRKIPGKVKGSYMTTEYDASFRPQSEVTHYQGRPCIVVRGLWKHAGHPGAFGGGPFVHYSLLDTTSLTVTNLCGYVYAPKYDKRELIRELEAMLQTIELR